MACVCSTNNCYSLPQGPLGEVFRLSDDGVANLAARGRRLIGRVAGAAGPDRRGGEAGDAQASSRSRNKADGVCTARNPKGPRGLPPPDGVARRRCSGIASSSRLAGRRQIPGARPVGTFATGC